MSSDWPLVSLGDHVDANLGKMLDAKKNKGTFQPYLGNRNVRWGHFDLTNLSEMKFEPHEEDRYSLEPGDLIVCEGGEPGRCAIWTEPKGIKIQKALHRIRVRKFLNNYYLFYWFCYANNTKILERYFTGTTIKHLTGKAISALEIALPPLITQHAIVSLLKPLDDRITLLRETNKTLESIAQAIFKSWFVDFDPVRAKIAGRPPEGMDEATAALFPDSFEESELGMIPEGWEAQTLGELVDALGGGTPSTKEALYWSPAIHHWTSPKDLSGLPSPVLLDTERRVSDAGLKKISSGLLSPGTLLMSSRAPIGYLAMTQIPVAINQGYIAIPPGGKLPPLYMFFWCKINMESIKDRANGSTFMEISKKSFREILAVKPDPKLIASFLNITETLFSRLIENEQLALNLANLRDTLLPRLISGKLRLPEAEELVEAHSQ